MKLISSLIIIFLSLKLSGQYIYLTYDKDEIEKEYATYYHDYYELNGHYVDSIFYMNGQPYEIIKLKSIYPYIKDGKYKLYYPTGELNYEIEYINGEKNGYMIGYYPSGDTLRKDYYENDSLISGKCFGTSGNDTTYFLHQVPPKFNYYGITDFREFINSNLDYPVEAAEKGLSGRVVVQFVIDTTGYISEARVKRTTNRLFNESAIKAIKKSPRWEPALRDGEKTKQFMTVPISYYLKSDY